MLRVNGALVRSAGALLRNSDAPFSPLWLSTPANFWLEGSATSFYTDPSTPATANGNIVNRFIRSGELVTNPPSGWGYQGSGNQCVDIDGSGRYWLKATGTSSMLTYAGVSQAPVVFTTDFCVWLVCYRLVNLSMLAFGHQTGNMFIGVYLDNNVYMVSDDYDATAGPYATAAYTGLNSTPIVMRFRRSGTTCYFATTGVSEFTLTGSAASTFTHNEIWSREVASAYFNTNEKVGMLVSMNGAPTATDLANMNSYTQQNWGVSL